MKYAWARIKLWWHCLTRLHRKYQATNNLGSAYGCYDCEKIYWVTDSTKKAGKDE